MQPKRILLVGAVFLLSGSSVLAAEFPFKVPPEVLNPPKAAPSIKGGSSCEPRADAPTSAIPTLVLERVAPVSGSNVTRNTSLVASLTYSVPDFPSSSYRLTAQFETTTPGMTFDGSFPNVSYPKACAPSGTFTVFFPLEYIWDVRLIRRPFRMIFFLLEGNDSVKRVVAESQWIEYTTK